MGLDMYMFRVEKISEREALELIGCHIEQIPKQYHYIFKDDIDDNPDPYCDLIPFLTQVTVVATMFNSQKCFAEHGVKCTFHCDKVHSIDDSIVDCEFDDVVGSYFGPNGAGWSFASGKRIDLSNDEYNSYLCDESVEAYVWKSQDVAYWRKFYDLDEFLQQLRIACRAKHMIDDGKVPSEDELKSWATENCGYYQLSNEEKQAVKEFLVENDAPFSSDCEEGFLDDDSAIMYHAWW